ncbi:MAG: gamma-glutamyltransferase, partial [Sphingopyxis sp.]|nr:gamma-glutamyltransferase [Sphingopyxis sp.]
MKLTARSIAIMSLLLSSAASAQDVIQTLSAEPHIEQVASTRDGGGLVSSADARASDAGRQVLAAGGSAADAAMATMIALTVVEPQSSGLGGGGFFVYHDQESGQTVTIDGREVAPAAARPERFLTADGRPMGMRDAVPGGLSVGVPGNMRLAAEVHRRFGRVSWAQLFEPAIRLADEGFTVSRWLATALQGSDERWATFPEIRSLYQVDGRAARQGETLRNPALAAMLREVAARG